MDKTDTQRSAELEVTAERVARIREAFVAAWKAGFRPRIEDYLSLEESLGPKLLPDLLRLEVEHRRQCGESPLLREYCDRFPGALGDVEQMLDTSYPAHAATRSRGSDLSAEAAAALVERHLGARFQILHLAGEGAMGWVFRAVHRRLEMPVAIKIIRPDCSTERFRREAHLLARLQSPYIVRVHDFEHLAEDLSVLIMEWIDGRNLERVRLDHGGRIPEEQTLRYMRNVCEGMLAAEAHGIVHRDLKPEN